MDGLPVVAVTLSEADGGVVVNRRYLIASLPGDGGTVVWVLEAPGDQWADSAGTLGAVPIFR